MWQAQRAISLHSWSVSVRRSQQVGEIRPVAAAKRRIKRQDVEFRLRAVKLAVLQAAKANRRLCEG